jgi:drug/metabolite transporter (DMT)-like permease
MSTRSVFELLALAALWGASFICLRIAAPKFGAISLIFLRVSIAALVLTPLIIRSRVIDQIKKAPWAILFMGLFMSAIPFTLFAYASHALEAGTMVVINATAPIWAALISSKMNGYRLTKSQGAGMAIGLLGVCVIAWSHIGLKQDDDVALAILAAMGATFCYGLGSSLGKRYLEEVSPMAITFGSLVFASALLAIPAIVSMPHEMPALNAWIAAGILGVGCTAVAYLLFYRLTKTIGGERAIAVTYLQPLFGIAWGVLLLGESISVSIVVGGLVILLGTALVTNLSIFNRR